MPWRHHVEVVTKCETIEEALFYVRRTIEESWSRSALVDCTKANLYHSVGNAITNFEENFVSLPEGYDEGELEDALEQNITRFLLEQAEEEYI